jgi:excisionase family DNA binding protein
MSLTAPEPSAPSPSVRLLSAEDVAEILGVTTSWVYAQSRAGQIPTVRLGRYYRYRRDAVQRWIETREVG